MTSAYKAYRRKNASVEMRPFVPGERLPGHVVITKLDRDNGSPKRGDMIVRNRLDFEDQWLIAAKYFKDNFEEDD
jgi:hypothetical protein